MNRKNFLLKFPLWVLSFILGYKIGENGSTIIIDQDGNMVSEKLGILDKQLDEAVKKQSGLISILQYGADTSKPALENTAAIQAAISAMMTGSVLVIPYGEFNITNLNFDIPDNCTIVCYGTLKSSSSGAAVTIGSRTKIIRKLTIQGLKVKSTTRDVTAGRIGINLINLFECLIDIREVQGFQKNIRCYGTNKHGFVYNEFHLGLLLDGEQTVYLEADAGGWTNENNFYGGRFAFSSAVKNYTNTCHITIIDYPTHRLNNNRFYSPSLETLNETTKAAKINGNNNAIIYPRLEAHKISIWTEAIELTTETADCSIIFGYGVFYTSISDRGEGNKIFTSDGISLKARRDKPIIKLRNNGSASYKAQSVEDVDGVERFYIKGSGELYSYQHGYFREGIRFNTSDLTYNDRGIFTGAGSPEGVITAQPGSMYLSASGGTNTTMYIKESGKGNTGWVAK